MSLLRLLIRLFPPLSCDTVSSFTDQKRSCLIWLVTPEAAAVFVLLTCSCSSPARFSLLRNCPLHFRWAGFTPALSSFWELSGSSHTNTKSVQWEHNIQTFIDVTSSVIDMTWVDSMFTSLTDSSRSVAEHIAVRRLTRCILGNKNWISMSDLYICKQL